MHRNPFRWLLPAALATAASAIQAQDPPRTATAPSGPLDAGAAVPAWVYRSSLADYRRLSDDKPIAWREANDTVGRIGGWRAYAREASEPEAPVAPALPAASMPPRTDPAPHGGHKSH